MPAGYPKRLDHWAACGGRKPRYRWLGVAPRSLPFWAGCVYTAGALLYNVGCTTNLADQFESVYLSPAAQVPLALCFLRLAVWRRHSMLRVHTLTMCCGLYAALDGDHYVSGELPGVPPACCYLRCDATLTLQVTLQVGGVGERAAVLFCLIWRTQPPCS